MNTTFLDQKGYIKLYIQQAGEDRKKFWKPIVKLMLALIIASSIVNMLMFTLLGDSILTQIVMQLVSFFISLYSIKFLLNLVDNKTVSLKETFKEFTGKQLLYALGAYFLMVIIVYLGFIFLIIPGIILSYMLMFTLAISSENTMSPVDVLKESRRLTNDYKLKMFNTFLSVGIHYLVIPIFAVLFAAIASLLGLPLWVSIIFIVIAIIFGVYAQFAYVTLLPRVYRDLQMIKGIESVEEVIEIEVEEVLEGNQEDSENKEN